MKQKPPVESMADVEGNARLRELSGSIGYPAEDWLTSLLYLLMRDAAPIGEVEVIVRELEKEPRAGMVIYTNGWLAQYAKHLADRIRARCTPP